MTDRNKIPRERKTGAAVLVSLVALGVTGCVGNDDPEPGVEEELFDDEPVEEPAEDSTYDLTYPFDPDYRQGIPDNLNALTGETVAVSVVIGELVSPTAFIVTEPGGEQVEELLVFHNQSLPDAAAGHTVGVEGVVRSSFDLSAIEEDLQTDLNEKLYKGSEGDPYIDATYVEIGTSESELGDDVEDIVQAGDITEEAGKTLTVSAEVDEVISPTAFTVHGTQDPAAGNLLVVYGEGQPKLTEAMPVEVTGVLGEAFSLPAVERELGLDLDEELFEDWSGERYFTAVQVDASPAGEEK